MGYKLFAFDLDGTLYDRQVGLNISDRTREAVCRVRELGAEVTIATGRMFTSTLRFSSQLGLSIPIITFQGALIGDPISREVIWERPVPVKLAREAIQLMEQVGVAPYVFVRNRFYVRKRNLRVEQYEEVLEITAEEVGDLAGHLEEDPTKLVAVGEEDAMAEIVRRINDAFGPKMAIIRTYKYMCEMGHPEGSKAGALKHLAHSLGVGRNETVAVGDSPNDIDMIRWAGLGVAMSTGPAEVQRAADMIAKPATEDGVAELLEGLISQGRISPLKAS